MNCLPVRLQIGRSCRRIRRRTKVGTFEQQHGLCIATLAQSRHHSVEQFRLGLSSPFAEPCPEFKMHITHVDGLAGDIFFLEVPAKPFQPSVFQIIRTRNNVQRDLDRGECLFRFLEIGIGPRPRQRAEHHQGVRFERVNRLDRSLNPRRSYVLDEAATGTEFLF